MSVNGKHLLHYVPHGINENTFKPIENKKNSVYRHIKSLYLDNGEYDFVVGFNSRNAHRKHPSNLILAFKNFCDHLEPEQAKKCALILHSDIVCEAGTDLKIVAKTICPDYKVVIRDDRFTPEEMCCFYNLCDVVANVSSNEGFGLSMAEAMMCGKPIIATVTGGLQDQLGFVDENNNPVEFSLEFSTNSTGKYKTHGKWAKPIWPKVFNLQGSPPTPYIFDDLTDYRDISEAIMYWYLSGDEKRKECGEEGRQWALNEGGLNSKNMCQQFIDAMDFTLENFIPEDSFKLYCSEHIQDIDRLLNDILGLELHKIDTNKIKEEINKI